MILRKTKELRIAYHNVFESPEGKLVLADLCRQCPLVREAVPVRANTLIDVNKLVFAEGQRSILWYIYKMLGRDPNEERPEEALNKAIGE